MESKADTNTIRGSISLGVDATDYHHLTHEDYPWRDPEPFGKPDQIACSVVAAT